MGKGQDPALEDVIGAGVAQRLASVFTSLPGVILGYDARTRAASVQVLIAEQYDTETGGTLFLPIPRLPNVPVVLPACFDFGMELPLKNSGGPCLVVWATSSIASWKRGSGGVAQPTHNTRFHIGDCFCIPGGFSPGAAPAVLGNDDAMTLGLFTPGNNGPVVAITPSDVRLGDKDASVAVATTTDLSNLAGALADGGVAQALYNYGIALGPAKVAALAALVAALATYFSSNSIAGSPNVKAKR